MLRRIEERLNGEVIVIPIANFEAFKYRRRCSLIDGLDLNRSFPGRENGAPTEQHAWKIWEISIQVDYIVDLHTCGWCVPYILAMYKENMIVREFVRKIPVRYVVESAGTRGQLFVEATRQNKKSLIIEVPQFGYRLNLKLGKKFARKLIQTLRNLDFLEGENKSLRQTYFSKRTDITTQFRGLFVPKRRRGSIVRKNEIIGVVNGKAIRAPHEGILLSIKPPIFVFCGEKVASIAKNRGA